MIDRARLTEKDRMREVRFIDHSGAFTGRIHSWRRDIVTVRCDHCGSLVDPSSDDIDFASGTYQDGGAE